MTTSQDQAASKPTFNRAQEVLLTTYSTGDFAHILDSKTQAEFDLEMTNCGDGLLRFLMVELSASEDCESLEEAEARVWRAIEDLQALQRNIDAAQEAGK